MRDDGSRWVTCSAGHRHWGRFGAAGVLLRRRWPPGRAPAGWIGDVLMQHRAAWTAHGGTWGIPGGARDSHESAVDAALRELLEEAGIDARHVTVTGEFPVDCGGGWTYTTVVGNALGDLGTLPPARHHRESDELRWTAVDEVDTLPLHPGFAASWPTIRAALP